MDFIIGTGVTGNYWIGLTVTNPDEAGWPDGSSLFLPNDWLVFRENAHCFILGSFTIGGRHASNWENRDCSKQYRYICEKEVGI